MKITTLTLALMALNPFCIKIDAIEEMRPLPKNYLSAEQISLENREIWVHIDGNWIQTKSLSADANGIFVKKDDFLNYWECNRCGYVNPPWNFIACGRCGNAK